MRGQLGGCQWHLAPAKGAAGWEGAVSRTKQCSRGGEVEQQETETADAASVAEVLQRTRETMSQVLL